MTFTAMIFAFLAAPNCCPAAIPLVEESEDGQRDKEDVRCLVSIYLRSVCAVAVLINILGIESDDRLRPSSRWG